MAGIAISELNHYVVDVCMVSMYTYLQWASTHDY